MLREMGGCVVLSAHKKPVGSGWSSQNIKRLQEDGLDLVFRPDSGLTIRQWYGLAYASFFKIIRQERAFGHSNPYHRTAFPEKWWFEQTESADLAEIHYSYWSHLPCACPKIVVVHDLWSNIMWEGSRRETLDLKTADLVVTVSNDDRNTLHKRGIERVIWSPPCVKGALYDDSQRVGIVGSDNRFNKEGISWLANARQLDHAGFKIMLYGPVSKFSSLSAAFTPFGSYKDSSWPYEQCGVIIIPTGLGTGLQIKAIEALAAGRAIVARKGAMRGFPESEKGWIEVETPEEMIEQVKELVNDSAKRRKQMRLSRDYYQTYLESNKVFEELKSAYLDVAQGG
jgi:glycosyltransferase involved in cell wall biosynthesis